MFSRIGSRHGAHGFAIPINSMGGQMENNRENLQVTRSQGQTSERQDSDQRIRQWLVKCGEVYGRQITPALVAIWVKGLEGMDGGMLENLFNRHLSTSRFFPVLADILAPQKEAAKIAVK